MTGGLFFFLKKLHLVQKHGPEKNYFLWEFWWRNDLGRKQNGPEMTQNGPEMIGNGLVRVIPVVTDGPGK